MELVKKIWWKFWGWIKPYLTPKMLPFMFISWCISDGWVYVFLALGTALDISWMIKVGGAWAAILWMPWSLEKPLITIPLAGLLYRLYYKEKFVKEEVQKDESNNKN